MVDFVALVTPPILAGPDMKPANGDIYVRSTNTVSKSGMVVEPFQAHGIIEDGKFMAKNRGPLYLVVTPEGVALEIIAELRQDGPEGQKDKYRISRTVSTPNQSTVTWDALLDTVPVESGTEYAIPAWVQPLLTEAAAAGPVAVDAANRAELAAASVPTPAELSATIDSKIAAIPVNQVQPDLFEALARMSQTTTMLLRKTSTSGAFQVSCFTATGQHITHDFAVPVDAYWKVGNIYSGGSVLTDTATSVVPWGATTRTGTFANATTAALVYTEQVGAKFSAPVTVLQGGGIRIKTSKSDRGGLWKFTLTETGQTMNLSVWAAGANAYAYSTLFTGLAAGTYTVNGEFLGADPEHAPSTAPARGWLSFNSLNGGFAETDLLSATMMLPVPTLTTLLGPTSNREFAYTMKPGDGSGSYEWVPAHSGIPSAVAAKPAVFLDGDKPLNVATMFPGEVRIVTSLQLAQNVYGRNTVSGATNLVEVWTTHKFTPDARMSISGKMTTLVPVLMGSTYTIMAPVKGDLFDKVQSSFGNTYPNTPAQYGTRTNLEAESDNATSYLMLSSTNKAAGIAFRYNDPSQTVRKGKLDKPAAGLRVFLDHRDAEILKHYSTTYEFATPVPAGVSQRFSGDYVHVVADGVYDLLAL